MHHQKHELSPLEAAQQAIIELQSQVIALQKDNADMAKFIRGSAGMEEPWKRAEEGSEEIDLVPKVDKNGMEWYTGIQYLAIKQGVPIDLTFKYHNQLFFRFTRNVSRLFCSRGLGNPNQIGFVDVYCHYDFSLLDEAWKMAKEEMFAEQALATVSKYLH